MFRKRDGGKSLRRQIGVALVAVVVGILAVIVIGRGAGGIKRETVSRNDWGEGDIEKDFKISIPGLSTEYSCKLQIPEREFTNKEEKNYIIAAEDEIKQNFLHGKEDLDAVYSNVNPQDSYQNEKVEAEWSFDSYEHITSKGEIRQETLREEGEIVNARVHLTCGATESIYEFAFHAYPRCLPFEEEIKREVNRQIAAQDKSIKEVCLPNQVKGYDLVWEEIRKPVWLKVILFGILCSGILVIWKKEKAMDEIKKRQGQMVMDYPEFVSKLSLLLGAGMTISAALKKMDMVYRGQIQKNKRVVYEELAVTMREIENGIGEYKAYSDFGERLGIWQYRRLGALLIQSQRMGNRKLIQQLNEEAKQAFTERKNLAKKLGEEAGTKLLFPMMLMMLLIMGLVLIPAYFSLQT